MFKVGDIIKFVRNDGENINSTYRIIKVRYMSSNLLDRAYDLIIHTTDDPFLLGFRISCPAEQNNVGRWELASHKGLPLKNKPHRLTTVFK